MYSKRLAFSNVNSFAKGIFKCVIHLSAGAQACVVAFSTVDRESFDAVKNWLRKVNYASRYT